MSIFLFKEFAFLWLLLGLHYCVWAFYNCSEHGLLSNCGARASHCSGFSYHRASLVAQRLKSLPAMWEAWV